MSFFPSLTSFQRREVQRRCLHHLSLHIKEQVLQGWGMARHPTLINLDRFVRFLRRLRPIHKRPVWEDEPGGLSGRPLRFRYDQSIWNATERVSRWKPIVLASNSTRRFPPTWRASTASCWSARTRTVSTTRSMVVLPSRHSNRYENIRSELINWCIDNAFEFVPSNLLKPLYCIERSKQSHP